jgi:dTDP-4-dehydrorhamnose 3,5-epimerase
MAMQKLDTDFEDAKIFIPDVYEDDRGFFKEVYNAGRYRAAGLLDTFVQDSVSYSTRNVIRGLHYDVEMSKLVTVVRGRIWDVIADVRAGSPTFGRWQGFYLSYHNHKQLYVPTGFGTRTRNPLERPDARDRVAARRRAPSISERR